MSGGVLYGRTWGGGVPYFFFSPDLHDFQERLGTLYFKKLKKIRIFFHNNELDEYHSFVLVGHITNDK